MAMVRPITDDPDMRDALDAALRRAVAGSFNRITVDGDMSTSDTVAILDRGRLAACGPVRDILRTVRQKRLVEAIERLANGQRLEGK